MKRKLLTAGLSAVLALTMAACADGEDPLDDGGVTDTGLTGDTSLDTTPTTVAP